MSSLAHAVHRALSPGLDAVAQAITSSSVTLDADSDAEIQLTNKMLATLHAKITSCRSLDEVIDVVHNDYRDALRSHLLTFAASAEKLETAKANLERLIADQKAGVVPQRLRVKAPEVQFTKDFMESSNADAVKALAAIKEETSKFQTSVMDRTIAAKKVELAIWEDKCNTEAQAKEGGKIVAETYASRFDTFKSPIFVRGNDNEIHLGSWTITAERKGQCIVAAGALPLFYSQILAIVKRRHAAASIKFEKKREVAAKADVEMADGTRNAGPSIQSLVDKTINARLKKLTLSGASKKVSRSSLSMPSRANDYLNYTEYVWPEYLERLSTANSPISVDETFEVEEGPHAGQQETERSETQEGSRFNSGQRSKVEGRKEGKRKAARLDAISVSPFRPSTFPDSILTMTWDDAVSFVHTHTPLSILEAGRFRSHVHTSPGVVVPREISNELSLGLKYLLFDPPDKKLIMDAWFDFYRRVRWRIYFLFQEGPDMPYDPDYGVESKKNTPPPRLPLWMETGLKRGEMYCRQTMLKIPESATQAKPNAFALRVEKVRHFLTNNNYVVTMTDKNLGLAVSERNWLIGNERTLLNDQRNFTLLAKKDADLIMWNKCDAMQKLANECVDVELYSMLKLNKYFESLITERGDEHVYPYFHGIPKIHKKPTGFRPIIPCHTVVFNPAAKFVSKELKPIVKSTPSIIHGTKDLFTRLSQLSIDYRRQFYFVSGDVVAFYPNIPLDKCMSIVCDMYDSFLLRTCRHDPYSETIDAMLEGTLTRQKLFKRAIEIGNTQLIAQHDEKYYLQLNGLAMGVADSPDLANLFAAHYENKSGIMNHPDVLFYGRYIDDVFALVYAESETEALELIQNKISYDGCTIEWNVSSSECQFLDALLFKDASGVLAWRPYVKLGNHRERIPFVSHHPMDVKRGVYIGECSRLAVLCSTKDTYMEAIRDLNSLYHVRGYPDALVQSWCRKNIQERWEKRYALRAEPEHDEGVLVLKTRFNDVWDWFDATELGNRVTGYWSEWLRRAELGDYDTTYKPYDYHEPHHIVHVLPKLFAVIKDEDGSTGGVPDLRKIGMLGRRWLVSRKRGTNLFDLSNVWKKLVIKKMDEAIADEGGVFPDAPSDNVTYDASANRTENPRARFADSESEHIDLHGRDSSEEEQEHPIFGRMSKRTN